MNEPCKKCDPIGHNDQGDRNSEQSLSPAAQSPDADQLQKGISGKPVAHTRQKEKQRPIGHSGIHGPTPRGR